MKRLCPKAICECKGGFQTQQDWPVLNLSSEAADALVFTGVGYTPFDPWRPTPLGDGAYYAKDCTGTQFSVASQELANLIARLNAIICQSDGQQFSNDAQTATLICRGTGLNFSIFWYTVPAGTFVSPTMNPQDGAAWIAASNAQALAYAQQQVSRLYCCLSSPEMRGQNAWECLNHDVGPGEYVYSLSGPNSSADYLFEVARGSFPSGLTLGKTSNNSAELTGTAMPAGKYDFTIRATRMDNPNVFAEVEDTLEIFGISNEGALPNCKVDTPYSHQLNAEGASPPYTFAFDPLHPPPSWMTITSSGLLGGTSTLVAPKSDFHIQVTDGNGHVCSHPFSIKVTGPKFLNTPSGGIQCDPYSFQFHTDPNESLCTFSGSCPAGLSISPTGLVTGIPPSPGPASFVITAVDAEGNSNTQTTSVNIASSGLAYATAIKDMVWVGEETVIGTATFTAYHVGGDVIYELDFPNADNSHVTNGLSYPQSLIGRCSVPDYPVTMTGVLTVSAPGGVLFDFNVVFTPDFCWTIGAGPLTSSSASHTVNVWNHLGAVVYVSFNIGNNFTAGLHVKLEIHFTPLTPP